MKVFISGSISVKSLDEGFIACLEQVVEGGRAVLIGDAYGVDRAVQQYLSGQDYRNVTVYFSGEKPRNNIGNWPTRQIPNPENLTGRKRYQLKDNVMAEECDSGMMFWDGKSKGTRHNINYMNRLGKYFLVLMSGEYMYGYNMHKINNMVIL